MSNKEQLVVQQAIDYFKVGDFDQAKICYEQARERYGQHLFAKSIELCDLFSRKAWATFLSTKTTSSNKERHVVANDIIAIMPSKEFTLKETSSYEFLDLDVPKSGASLVLTASVKYRLLRDRKTNSAVVLFEFFDKDGNRQENISGLGFSSVFKKYFRYLNDNSDNLQDDPEEIVKIKLDDNIARVKMYVAPLNLKDSEQVELKMQGCLFNYSEKNKDN